MVIGTPMRKLASPSITPIPHVVTHASRMVAQRGRQMVCQQSVILYRTGDPPFLGCAKTVEADI